MPTFKRFYPPEGASKAINEDADKANDILDDLENEEWDTIYLGNEWLKDLEIKDKDKPKRLKSLEKDISELKLLIAKLAVVGVQALDEYPDTSAFSNITQALTKAYPPQVMQDMFQNQSPFLAHLKKKV